MNLLELIENFLLHGALLARVGQDVVAMFDEEGDGSSLDRNLLESAVGGRCHQRLTENTAQVGNSLEKGRSDLVIDSRLGG